MWSFEYSILFWLIYIIIMVTALGCIFSSKLHRLIFRSTQNIKTIRCLLVIYLYIVIRVFIVDIYKVRGNSMLPTLQPGDYVVVSKLSYGPRLPALYEIPIINLLLYVYPFSLIDSQNQERFTRLYSSNKVRPNDIVVCNQPIYQNSLIIKRCIAKAGEELSTRQIGQDKLCGIVPYKGMTITETLLDSLDPTTRRTIRFYYPSQILKDSVKHFVFNHDFIYLVGDNLSHSTDSRSWGPVKTDHIIGKVIKIFHKKKQE